MGPATFQRGGERHGMAAGSDTTPVPCIEQLTAPMAKQMRSETAEPLPACDKRRTVSG
jgi:hypothetical protein